MKTVAELCKAHRRKGYFLDENNLTGVVNDAGSVSWYGWTEGGYSLIGETRTAGRGADYHKLKDETDAQTDVDEK